MPTTPAQPSETQLPAAQHETEQPNTSPEPQPQPQPQAQPKAAHPLRSRNFILLVAGQGISLFGNMMLRFAMSMWVLDYLHGIHQRIRLLQTINGRILPDHR